MHVVSLHGLSATGGQFGQIYIMKKQGIKVSDAASLLWADFIVYQTTMMIYFDASFPFEDVLHVLWYKNQSKFVTHFLLNNIH